MSLDHLRGSAREAMRLTPRERIEFIQKDRWIGYAAAKTILSELQDLTGHPRNLRMPCRVVIGDPTNGKTMLLQECMKRNPAVVSESDEARVPVLIFETPPKPSEARLYSEILKAYRVAHRTDARAEELLPKVIDRVVSLDTRLLMADEFHNMLNGSSNDQRQLLASLKSLLNALRIPFVAAGTRDAMRALATDGQFVTRFEQLALPRWGLNQESRRLLASLEETLPLAEPSNLAGRELGEALILGGGGTIGGITALTKQSAVAAIKSGEERITRKTVDAMIEKLRARAVVA